MSRDIEDKSRLQNGTGEYQDTRPEPRFAPPRDVEKIGKQYENDPPEAKTWLTSFGALKPDTDVSLRFQLSGRGHAGEKPYSLLPMLSGWMSLWFKKCQGPTELMHKKYLSWLLNYTAQYLNLGHDDLNQQEIIALCTELHYICNRATLAHHILDCLAVYQALADTQRFPPVCLKDAIMTFCNAIVVLERPFKEIQICVHTLAAGSYSKDTVNILYDQVTNVTNTQFQSPLISAKDDASIQPKQNVDANELTKPTTLARGAMRHLGYLIETCGIDERYVLRLPQLLNVTKQAAEVKHFRLNTEILNFCAHLLDSDRGREIRTTPELLTKLFNTVNECTKTTLTPELQEGSVYRSQQSKEDILKREERYRSDHESATLEVKVEFIKILPKTGKEWQSRFWTDVVHSLKRVQAKERQMAIDYARSQEVCMPGRPDWENQLDTLIDQVVLNDDVVASGYSSANSQSEHDIELRNDQRIDVLQLCTEAIMAAATSRPEHAIPSAKPYDTAMKALCKMFGLFPDEKYTKVRRAFLIAMRKLSDVANDRGLPIYAETIISKLQKSIVNYPSNGVNKTEEAVLAGTRMLREIFLQSIARNTATSNQAYKALLSIARDSHSRRSRLAAMTLLFRIRCSDSAELCVDITGESAYIANALCKTDHALNSVFANAVDTPGSIDGSTKLKTVLEKQLWVYPREQLEVDTWTVPEKSVILVATGTSPEQNNHIQMSHWVELIIEVIHAGNDWEIYSYVIVHLAAQLLNMKLFEKSYPALVTLRKVICERIIDERIMEPPSDMGLRKSDVALCLYHILSRLIPYSQVSSPDIQEEGFSADLVRAFVYGVDSMSEGSPRGYEGTARSCIHALSLCCFETPAAMSHQYYKIIDAMSRSMSQSHLVVHILEFLAQIARLPSQHGNFSKDDIKRIFAMCIQFLEKARIERTPANSLRVRASTPARSSGLSLKRPPYRAAMLQEKGLPQYSMALAYHTMFFWFLSLGIEERASFVKFIVDRLVWRNSDGKEEVDEQSRVFVDMMHRSAYSDLGETAMDSFAEQFLANAEGHLQEHNYIVGQSVITIQMDTGSGRSLITKRQASGTTYAMYRPLVQDTPKHFDQSSHKPRELGEEGQSVQALPSHTLLNMIGSAHPYPPQVQPFLLPKTDEIARAIRSFDRISDVDSHKIGILGLKSGQSTEQEYLSNTDMTPSLDHFLTNLGTRMSLKPPVTAFKPFGLTYEIDGTETVAWRDRVNEIVFAISSFMPNAEDDKQFVQKKQHLGNCSVLIVFNESNKPWNMSMFASQVTLCNIVITPVNRSSDSSSSDSINHEFFQVEVLTKEEYQNISPAAETKVVSKDTLAPFVRMLALNANIFSSAAVNQGDDEFPSSWRSRLQMIRQLRENAGKRQSASVDLRDDWDPDSLAFQYDFSRWTC